MQVTTTCFYTIIQFTNNSRYSYQDISHAACVLLGGATGAALTGTVTTGMVAPALTAVSGTTDTGFTLGFTAPTGATGQTVASYAFTVTATGGAAATVTAPSNSDTSVDVTGLTAATEYTYSLAAVDAGNDNMFLYNNPIYK